MLLYVYLIVCSNSVFPFSTMYWADWGNHPKIETAAMDGTLRQTLVHENIQWPTGQYSSSSTFTALCLGAVQQNGSLLFYISCHVFICKALPFCLYRFGCGLLQRASLLGRCKTLSDWQCSSGWLGSCHFCLWHQKQLSSKTKLCETSKFRNLA